MDALTPDDAESFAFLLKRLELAQHAVDTYAAHLVAKYKIAPPDQLNVNGTIKRANKADAP
jgi:hypothetical protein